MEKSPPPPSPPSCGTGQSRPATKNGGGPT